MQIGGDFDMGSLGSMMKRAMLPSILGGGKRKFEIAMLKKNLSKISWYMHYICLKNFEYKRFYNVMYRLEIHQVPHCQPM